MRNFLLTCVVVLCGINVFADDQPTIIDNQPIVQSGYFDLTKKQLVVTGPAAEALWNQMTSIQTQPIMNGIELEGRSKESNGTSCEQTSYRPRPLAHSVFVYSCTISLEKVGVNN